MRSRLLASLFVFAFAGCTAVILSPDPKPGPETEEEALCVPSGDVVPQSMLRVTRAQEDNLVKDLLGASFAPSSVLPNDEKLGPFAANGVISASRGLVEQYQFVAQQIAAEVQADVQRFAPCANLPAGGATCAAAFIHDFGRRAFRGRFDAEAETRWLALYTAEAMAAGYANGIGAVIEGMLQSPYFLYRVELLPEGLDPASSETWTVDAPALASRLSFLVWNSGPDEALLSADLSDPAVRAEQTKRMLADDKARHASAAFAEGWAGIDSLAAAASSASRVGPLDPLLLPMMREETVDLIDRLRVEGASTRVLFADAHARVPSALATQVYGATATPGADGRVPVPMGRFGLLGQASVLFSHAHSDQTSPVLRGRWLRQNVFCQIVPDPPPEVVAIPPPPQPGQTTRERYDLHRTEASCAACHKLLDPIGFGFESFDQYGRHRDTDSGKMVDDTGRLTATDVDGDFKGLPELSQKLSTSQQVRECFSKQWFRFGLGRAEGPRDLCTIKSMAKAGAGTGFHALVNELVASPAFSQRRNP